MNLHVFLFSCVCGAREKVAVIAGKRCDLYMLRASVLDDLHAVTFRDTACVVIFLCFLYSRTHTKNKLQRGMLRKRSLISPGVKFPVRPLFPFVSSLFLTFPKT